jgi:serine/threonine-protein kinase
VTEVTASALADALRDRYVLERELGRGGMATVYLARDLRHDRPVALKVLHPELAATLGPDRFLREIRIAARLQHPHILPLHDSGEGAGRLWYTMPYVEGESLRGRLRREIQLPLEVALGIARQIAGALDYAHQHGVVHRDMKPENVLLSGDEALVADFGIAKALDAAGGEKLTETGLSLGTPAYMSPEQATASPVDGRADIYSLGCIVYEMLAGDPPFAGASPRAVLARHAVDPVPAIRTARPGVPAHLEQAINRALAKVPADRFATAGEFGAALELREDAEQARTPTSRPRSLRLPLLSGIALAAVTVSGFLLFRRHPSSTNNMDPGLVAVLPFRVAGADSALSYLREGMLDLLAMKLTGEGGPRAVDPRAVLDRLRRVSSSSVPVLAPEGAVQLAAELGAGRMVDGSIAGTPSHLILSASIMTVPAGTIRARASVAGPADSLPGLVDRLTAQLLAGEAGKTELATVTSLPSLRAYLEGQAALRGGRFHAAFRSFDQSLHLDSGFALAAMGLSESASWSGDDDEGRGLRLAWAARDQLGPGDRALLLAQAGPHGPAPSSAPEILAAREQAVAVVPERPEAWYELGDMYFHQGALLGVDAPLEKAASAFRRALELDSSALKTTPYAEPLEHLFEIAAEEGDTATVRRLGTMVLAADSGNEYAGFYRWRMAQSFHDTAALAMIRTHLDRMHPTSLKNIAGYSAGSGLALSDGRLAIESLLRRASSNRERWVALLFANGLAMNSGHPREALAAIDRMTPKQRADGEDYDDHYRILAALFWDGDSSAALQALRRLAKRADRPLARSQEERIAQSWDICVVQQWRLAHGELGSTPAAITKLRQAVLPGTPDSAALGADPTQCAILLEAWLASAARQPGAVRLVGRLDSLLRTAPDWIETANLLDAHLLEAGGDVGGALAAVRRRRNWPKYLSSYLREEGRLAALAGDTAGAIAAYEHYLKLRSDPEPSLKPQADRVRAELANLVSEPR